MSLRWFILTSPTPRQDLVAEEGFVGAHICTYFGYELQLTWSFLAVLPDDTQDGSINLPRKAQVCGSQLGGFFFYT